MTSYWVDDIPAETLDIELDLPDVDLALFPAVEAKLTNPEGAEVSLTGATFAIDAEGDIPVVTVNWGSPSRFVIPGLHQLQLTLVGFGQNRQRIAPEGIVVEELDGWHNLASARTQWADAPYDDVQLHELLTIAAEQCLEYAPALPTVPGGDTVPGDWTEDPDNPGLFFPPADGGTLPTRVRIPTSYKRAQLMQSRNIWNATKQDGGQEIGPEGFAIRVFPLDFHVRQLLRPKRGVPFVG